MIDTFYLVFWQPLSLCLFELVALPSMSMFPFRFHVKHWQKMLMIMIAAILSGILAVWLREQRSVLSTLLGIQNYYFLGQLMHLISMVLFCTIIYKGQFLSMLLSCILALSLAGQLGFVYGELMLVLWKPEFDSGMVILRDILGYGSFALYFHFLRCRSNISSFHIGLRDHLIMILFSFLLFSVSCFGRPIVSSSSEAVLLFYSTCSFATFAITFLLFRFTREQQRKLEQQRQIQDLQLSENALEQMKETSAQIKELQHELGNHFIYIETLVEGNQTEELKQYLRKVSGWMEDLAQPVTTANPVINAVLNQKLSYARSLGIETKATVVLPDTLSLEDMTLCALLGNLLNNAIAACNDIQSPFIGVEIHPLKSYLVFRIENSVSYNVLEKNPHLLSTKEDAENHGIGLRVVKRLVEENNGMLHYEMSGPDRFVVQVMLLI